MRRSARGLALGAAIFCLTPAAHAVTMDWTFIGNPGNANDNTGFGAVGYSYSIGTYEVTYGQYAEFLNAKAKSDPLSLYNGNMGVAMTRGGVSGSYTYTVAAGSVNSPINHVSFYDALRFANWMYNGQGTGDTETGAYTLLGGTATPSNGTTVARNAAQTAASPIPPVSRRAAATPARRARTARTIRAGTSSSGTSR